MSGFKSCAPNHPATTPRTNTHCTWMQYSRSSSSFSTLEYCTIIGMIRCKCSPTLWPAWRLFKQNNARYVNSWRPYCLQNNSTSGISRKPHEPEVGENRKRHPGTRFSKVPKTSRAIRKTPTDNSVKLVYSYVVKGITIKITAKFRVETHSFWRFIENVPYITRNAPEKFSGLSRSRSLHVFPIISRNRYYAVSRGLILRLSNGVIYIDNINFFQFYFGTFSPKCGS